MQSLPDWAGAVDEQTAGGSAAVFSILSALGLLCLGRKAQCLLDCLQIYRTELNISKTAAFCKGTACQGPALGSCPADEVCCHVPAPPAWDPHATASPQSFPGLPASALSPLQGKSCPRLPNLHLKPSASHRGQGAGASPYYFSYPVTKR